MMACPGDAMNLEREFSKALSEVENYQVAGSELKFTSLSGEALAVFKKE